MTKILDDYTWYVSVLSSFYINTYCYHRKRRQKTNDQKTRHICKEILHFTRTG